MRRAAKCVHCALHKFADCDVRLRRARASVIKQPLLMNGEPMSRLRAHLLIFAGIFAAALFPVAAGAKVLTVMGIGEPATIDSANCDVNNWNCSTLRDAMNNTASGDSIRFSSAIDGQTIVLEFCSNPASGTEFGPSAF